MVRVGRLRVRGRTRSRGGTWWTRIPQRKCRIQGRYRFDNQLVHIVREQSGDIHDWPDESGDSRLRFKEGLQGLGFFSMAKVGWWYL